MTSEQPLFSRPLFFVLLLAIGLFRQELITIADAAAGDAACSTLSSLELPHVVVTAAESVAAGDYEAADGKIYKVPTFCRVHAVAVPTADSHINIEVWLPAKDWNGRYYQLGTGGFAGSIAKALPALARSITAGNAVAVTDSGHKGGATDASWALNEPEKVIDYGYRSLKETTDVAKSVIAAYYRKGPDYSYFSGCSNGGRQAMVVAHRYAQDWDGILIGAPANDVLRTVTGFAWNYHALWGAEETRIPLTKLPAIQKAALASCTKDAHVIDGVAADPRFCPFDPTTIICTGAETDSCLTAPQASALKKIYGGAVHPETGASLSFGFAPTMENEGEWVHWVIGAEEKETVQYKFAQGFFANMVFNDPDWDVHSFDYAKDPDFAVGKAISGTTLEEAVSIVSPDFKAIQKHGGKVMLYHGWGDAAVMPRGMIADYENAARGLGGMEEIQAFARLFMVPGMLHCADGPGANAFGQFSLTPGLKNDAAHDIHRALEAWVEKGRAPEKIIATKYVDNKPESGVAFTRPICPYPKIPVYKGQGDVGKAKNFACKTGAEPPVR